MKFINIIFIISFLFFNIQSNYGYINYSDNVCLTDLLFKSKQSVNFPLEEGQDYCSRYQYEFDCDNDGYIRRIYFLYEVSSYQFKSKDFKCFKNELAFIHKGGSLDPNFFNDSPRLKAYGSQTDAHITGVVNLSTLSNLSYYSRYGPNVNVTYNNDLTQDLYFEYFEVSTSNIPVCTHIKAEVSFYLSKWFDSNSYSNFTTIQDVYSLYINGDYSNNIPLDFPLQLLERPPVQNYYTYAILFDNINFNKPSNYLDFTKQTSDISFANMKSNFLIDNKIPIRNTSSVRFSYQNSDGITDLSNLVSITQNAATILFSSNGLTNNMDELLPFVGSKLQSLQLSNNRLVGTLNEKFCNFKNLGINGNRLTGTLNSCYTCHFGPKLPNSNLRVDMLAGFSNLDMPTEPCKTIVPNLRFDYGRNRTYLFGKDLGFDIEGSSPYFQTTPTARWYNDVPSESFYKLGTETSTFHVYFRYPGLNYTVTADPQKPIIDNIYVSNDGSLTINGTNFSHNISLIQVDLGQTECIITYATFYQIFCTLESFDGSTSLVDISTDITIDQLTTTVPVTIIPDFLNQYLECSSECSGNSHCDRNSGTCICDCKYNEGEICNIKTKSCNIPCSSNCNYPNGTCDGNIGECSCGVSYYGESCQNKYIDCNPSCSLNGNCNRLTGICECNQDYYGESCESKYIECNPSCSSNGQCNRVTGICECDQDYYGESCENKYIDCNPSCSSNGQCNRVTGICQCNQDYHGESCTIQQHYVGSIEHSVLSYGSGDVILSGLFTQLHNDLSVTIGSLNCQVLTINETTITCNLESGGSGIQSTTVKQNGLIWSRINSFEYLTTTKQCPNNCTSESNGICNESTGNCKCINNFKGPDCSSIGSTVIGESNQNNTNNNNELPPSKPSIDNESGSAVISNQEVLYGILITKLVEYNINGQEVKSIDLQNKWILDKDQSNNNVSIFSQVTDSYHNSIITSRFEIINQDSDYSFAGVDFFIESGSIKISIDISNYKFKSNLNTLQIQIQSNVTEDSNKKENSCNDKETTIDGFNDSSAINYIKINKNGRILSGKLINYALSDSRPTFITSTIVERSSTGITVGINLPHFSTSCSIDPDYQVLLKPTFKTSCGKSRPSYIIPLSVALPVAGVASIIGATIFFFKKRKEAKEFKSIKIKLNNINN